MLWQRRKRSHAAAAITPPSAAKILHERCVAEDLLSNFAAVVLGLVGGAAVEDGRLVVDVLEMVTRSLRPPEPISTMLLSSALKFVGAMETSLLVMSYTT